MTNLAEAVPALPVCRPSADGLGDVLSLLVVVFAALAVAGFVRWRVARRLPGDVRLQTRMAWAAAVCLFVAIALMVYARCK